MKHAKRRRIDRFKKRPLCKAARDVLDVVMSRLSYRALQWWGLRPTRCCGGDADDCFYGIQNCPKEQ